MPVGRSLGSGLSTNMLTFMTIHTAGVGDPILGMRRKRVLCPLINQR